MTVRLIGRQEKRGSKCSTGSLQIGSPTEGNQLQPDISRELWGTHLGHRRHQGGQRTHHQRAMRRFYCPDRVKNLRGRRSYPTSHGAFRAYSGDIKRPLHVRQHLRPRRRRLWRAKDFGPLRADPSVGLRLVAASADLRALSSRRARLELRASYGVIGSTIGNMWPNARLLPHGHVAGCAFYDSRRMTAVSGVFGFRRVAAGTLAIVEPALEGAPWTSRYALECGEWQSTQVIEPFR